MTALSWVRPSHLKEASTLLGRPGALPLAGGTDLLPCLRDGCVPGGLLVSLGGLTELGGIETTDEGGVRLGALTTVAQVAAYAGIHDSHRALSQAATAVGSPQIRSQGTVGGNLCQAMRCPYYRGGDPCTRRGDGACSALAGEARSHAILGGGACVAVHPSDLAPALVALDAQVVLWGKRSRRMPVHSLFVIPQEDPTRTTRLAPGEVLAEVLVPPPPAGLRSSYTKVRSRGAWDFALVGVALALVLDGRTITHARVVLSGVAPVPWRSQPAEAALVGQILDPTVARKAGEAAVAKARPLQGNSWKIDMTRELIARELVALAAG